MTRRRHIGFLATLTALPLTVVALAGCGGGGSKAAPAPPKTASGGPATVGVANVALGKILVNSQGRTLYLFQKDLARRARAPAPAPSTGRRFGRAGSPRSVAG